MPAEPSRPVVVGVDASRASLDAVDLAAEEAVVRGVALVVAHVVADDGRRSDARPLVEAAVARAHAVAADLVVSTELLVGEPADCLAARSRMAGLLVVGHRSRGPGRGSGDPFALRVAGLTEVAVMVQRPTDGLAAASGDRPVLAAIDVETVDAVLRFAFGEAAWREAPLLVMYAPATPDPSGNADDRLVDALTRWSDKYPEVPVGWTVRQGLDLAVVLTASSRSARLVVAGVPGAAPRPASPAGHALVHRAGCPVVLVPAR